MRHTSILSRYSGPNLVETTFHKEFHSNAHTGIDIYQDNKQTGEVKFVDWNWASYAPAKFGATEFLLDMTRRGVDTSPWYKDMSVELLAATVGYYMIRSLKPPHTPGSTLREMQAETAAVANYLYEQLRSKL